MDGILLVDKPPRWTSHDAVDFVRRAAGQKRVGHAGTLDPMATGLLVLLLGAATKRSAEFMGLDKDYTGSIRLGVTTDTWDLEGKVLSEKPAGAVTRESLERIFAGLEGPQSIVPPAYSAIKQGGKKLYELARRGVAVEAPPREITVAEFRLERFESPEAYFFVSCSKGTYVRSLAHLVGERAGCGGTLSSLVRTRIGRWHLKDAMMLDRPSTGEDIECRLLRAE